MARALSDELLNETLFFDLDNARTKIAVRITDDNQKRPHSSLGDMTPAASPPASQQRAIG